MELKEKIHAECLKIIRQRIESIENELKELQTSQRADTKSSAGDKYETGREMINMEKNKLGSSLEEALKMENFLKQIDAKDLLTKIRNGALVHTDKGNFYLSVGLGSLVVDEMKVFVVSPVSPIGQQMLDKRAGDSFEINGVPQLIEKVH